MKNFKVPHVFIFLFWIIIACSILTYFIPSGTFERTTKVYGNQTRTVVVPNSYKEVPKHYSLKGVIIGDQVEGKSTPVSALGVLEAIPKGLGDSAVLVFYVFVIGALITLIQHTGAVNALLFRLINKFQKKPKRLIFLIFMIVFSSASFMGIAPSTIAFIPVLLSLSKRLGYDRMFGIGLLAVPIFMGWASGVSNPFTVQIAQVIAELPVGSGIGLRLLLYCALATVGFYFLMKYGEQVKANPSKSLMKDDAFNLDEFGSFEAIPLERKHILIMLFFVVSFVSVLMAVQFVGWGLIQMSAGFIGITIVVTLMSGLSGDEAMAAYTKGLEVMIVPALVVGLARGISVVLQDGMIIDSLIHYASEALMEMPTIMAAEGMLVFQSCLNFLIPSASGQALVSMPLLTPMSDILDISRQTTVLAFILGDGLSNLIIPTNGVLMAMLGLAKVPFEKWFKFVLPMFIVSMIVGFAFVAAAVMIGY